MADGVTVRHWTVDDGAFTDRWEVESGDPSSWAWVDRVVEGGTERFDWLAHANGGDMTGSCDTLDDALAIVTGACRG